MKKIRFVQYLHCIECFIILGKSALLGADLLIFFSIINFFVIGLWGFVFAKIHWASFLLWAHRISILTMITYIVEHFWRSILLFGFFPFTAVCDAEYVMKYEHFFILRADELIFYCIKSKIHFMDDSILLYLLLYNVFL